MSADEQAPENWQVQELDGTSISDHSSREDAEYECQGLAGDYQRPFRVRRTA